MAVTLKYILVCVVIICANVKADKSTYKICVPKQYLKACEEMLEVPTKSKVSLECVPARDRVQCLGFVQQRQADLVPTDPEDMYVASKMPNQDFVVFQEYRTDEEPDAEFRYEAVIVVHKDLPIKSLDELKGLKSCHTGVNRNVGYKLPVGTTPASESPENPDEFAYLCVDGSKVPIRGKPCTWAARPWQGLIGHQDVLAKLTPLREKIKQLADSGASSKPEWFLNVLGLSEKIHHVADNIPIKPADYLKKANYTEVIERGHGPPEPVVRLCVTTYLALEKCRLMSVFAFSRDIRPRIDCVQEESEDACLKSVQDNGADLAAVDDMRVASASKQYNLHPVFHEVYGDKKTPNYAVAVVKKDSNVNKIEDLRGKRSCHNSFGSFSGLAAPLFYLINKKLINSDQCVKNLGDFFSGGSCLPGVDKPENNPRGEDVSNMKKRCSGDGSALQCLQNNGDVAFVSSADLSKFDGSQYELLCLNRESGGRDSFANFATCNVVMSPSRTWLSAKDFLSDVSIAHAPLSLAELLDTRSDLFNIYGEFYKNNNVLFNNAARGLVTTEKLDFEKFKTIHDVLSTCGIA
ncbi:PREDICTED: transferrin [Papilio polytes]|uniref:transferrin n=1 Tax=Papilio polytes TaxID=76194 RepID=UPI00067693AE|nr:PREDICTED: transferrin [Papilio polytes]